MNTRETNTFRKRYGLLPDDHRKAVQEAIRSLHEADNFPPQTLSAHILQERLIGFWSIDNLEEMNDLRIIVKPIKDGVLLVNVGYHDRRIYR